MVTDGTLAHVRIAPRKKKKIVDKIMDLSKLVQLGHFKESKK